MNILNLILPTLVTTLFGICGWLFIQLLKCINDLAVLTERVNNLIHNCEKLDDKLDHILEEIRNCDE